MYPKFKLLKMAKRAAEDEQGPPGALKSGERPVADNGVVDGEEFEDEFEDEFESEDEVLEAGVDGRPDEEREAEERANGRGQYILNTTSRGGMLTRVQAQWMWMNRLLYLDDISWMLAKP